MSICPNAEASATLCSTCVDLFLESFGEKIEAAGVVFRYESSSCMIDLTNCVSGEFDLLKGLFRTSTTLLLIFPLKDVYLSITIVFCGDCSGASSVYLSFGSSSDGGDYGTEFGFENSFLLLYLLYLLLLSISIHPSIGDFLAIADAYSAFNNENCKSF